MAAEESTLKEESVEKTPQTQEKILFSWDAQTRPFKRQGREVYVTLASVGVLFALILFVIDGIMPVLLIIALGFLFYVISNVEPEKASYRITTWGVRIVDSLTPWENLTRFWFAERLGSHVVVLEKGGIVGRMELVIDPKDKDALAKALGKYMVHEEAVPTLLDKSANWVASKIQQ